MAVEAFVGYPEWLFRLIRHPVVWFGALIDRLESGLNRKSWRFGVRRAAGAVAVLALVCLVAACALVMTGPPGLVAAYLVACALPAQHSLWSHVRAVADGLEHEGLDGGRRAVAHIVGRDPESLDEAGVVRAAVESLAENFSDGVVAPAFWGCVFGLPGMLVYKAVNTADSMIGHRTKRYEAFGWAAARLDDLVNLPASRLAALWIVLAACLRRDADPAEAIRAVLRDARRHRSPNAGWPEAAMAGALGLRLAGPRRYGGALVEDAWMGQGRAAATVADLRAALGIYAVACGIEWALVAALAIWLNWPG